MTSEANFYEFNLGDDGVAVDGDDSTYFIGYLFCLKYFNFHSLWYHKLR